MMSLQNISTKPDLMRYGYTGKRMERATFSRVGHTTRREDEAIYYHQLAWLAISIRLRMRSASSGVSCGF